MATSDQTEEGRISGQFRLTSRMDTTKDDWSRWAERGESMQGGDPSDRISVVTIPIS